MIEVLAAIGGTVLFVFACGALFFSVEFARAYVLKLSDVAAARREAEEAVAKSKNMYKLCNDAMDERDRLARERNAALDELEALKAGKPYR